MFVQNVQEMFDEEKSRDLRSVQRGNHHEKVADTEQLAVDFQAVDAKSAEYQKNIIDISTR